MSEFGFSVSMDELALKYLIAAALQGGYPNPYPVGTPEWAGDYCANVFKWKEFYDAAHKETK